MQPLIDADVLRYEIGAVGQYVDGTDGLCYRDFEWVATVFDDRIRDICEAVGATEAPILFLTGTDTPNFREGVAVSKPYKGTRKGERPFHYHNLTAYIRFKYDTRVAEGCEADDLISIEQYSRRDRRDSVICTRDKDLRMCPGLHYGWECGKQPELGPIEYDDIGTISLVKSGTGNSIRGGGKAFFFSQLLTGDTVDNIGGLRGTGAIKAYDLLSECKTEEDYRTVIVNAYKAAYADQWLQLLTEQSDLLWIVRQVAHDGSLVHYDWSEYV